MKNESFSNDYEIKKATEDIKTIRTEMKEYREDYKESDKRITKIEKQQAINQTKLDTIIKNTERTQNLIQNTVYGAVGTGVIGGAIAIIWSYLGGG